MTLKQVIEALLFASPKPMQAGELLSALQAAGEKAETDGPERMLGETGAESLAAALEELRQEYEQAGRGILLVEQVNGWGLVTNPAASPWVRRLYPEAKPTRLSGPALETLAIIAYRQPVTRADVEAVRGVAVDGVMQVLLDRSLVKIAGRAEVPGRPLLYSTTEFFLQHFGLKTVDELPNASELKRYPLPQAPIAAPEPETGKAKKAKPEPEEEAPVEAPQPEPASEAPPATEEPSTEPAEPEATAQPED